MKTIMDDIREKESGNVAAYARRNGVTRATIYNWINKGDIIVNGVRFEKKDKVK